MEGIYIILGNLMMGILLRSEMKKQEMCKVVLI